MVNLTVRFDHANKVVDASVQLVCGLCAASVQVALDQELETTKCAG